MKVREQRWNLLNHVMTTIHTLINKKRLRSVLVSEMHCEKLSRKQVVWRQPLRLIEWLDVLVPTLASRVGRLSSASTQVDAVCL